MNDYLMRVFTALSILFNVILGGSCNQTFSARNYERKRSGQLHLVEFIDMIFYTDPEHCLGSWVNWQVRKTVIETFHREKREKENGNRTIEERSRHYI